MTHQEFELYLDAYLDGELASEDARAVEAHAKDCRDCARLQGTRIALSTTLREQVPRFRAPDALRTRVQTALRAAAGAPVSARRVPPIVWRVLALAASLAVVAVGSWRMATNGAAGQALAEQVLTSHVRSLMPGHLTDVASSDQHTVKPWFNGRLDFSPPVYDFATRGFPLVGGRLDYLGGRSVAALVYGRRQHMVNVFLWPSTAGAMGERVATRQGYHLLHWATAEYVYWVASDLGLAELHEFAGLLRQADSAAASSNR
ncbi:MAG TPA: anti-sigma factor [Gemmatimonadales bacterium]|nr:anti-sigma factor [Gemmatimonadales bacterium]